jgi:hypothetical protein
MEIVFSRGINELSKKKFILHVIEICSLTELRSDPSYEGGFNLPLTYEWYKKDLINKEYLKYHDSRQLRFVKDHNINKIIGLRYKDGINYWNDDELQTLKESIEKILLDFNE